MIYLASLDEAIEDKLSRYTFIHDKVALAKVVCETAKANTIIFRKDFIEQYFTPTGFDEYCRGVRSLNPNLVIKVDNPELVETVDSMTRKIINCRNMREILMLASAHEKEFVDTILTMANASKRERDAMLYYSTQISQLQTQASSLLDELDDLRNELNNEQQTKLEYQSKYNNLVARINYQYGLNYNADKVFQVQKHSYDKVLYFKEISRVQYTDSFIYYLQQILKIIYGMPTRIVVIESYYADGKVGQYPRLKPHYTLTQEDVISGDILMLGIQPNTMQDILKNASNVSFLIVLDRAGYSQPHIIGDNVEYFYLTSDLKDKPEYVDKLRCISYDDSTLNIPHVDNFNVLDDSAKMTLYSSYPIVKSIVGLINGG